jgi:hypothetical protein
LKYRGKGGEEELEQIAYHYHKLEKLTDLDPLFEEITNNVKYVLLREASHGTSEFYNWRIEITKRLIAEREFSFVAAEGDWPDCYNINCYVKGISADLGEGRPDKEVTVVLLMMFYILLIDGLLGCGPIKK